MRFEDDDFDVREFEKDRRRRRMKVKNHFRKDQFQEEGLRRPKNHHYDRREVKETLREILKEYQG